MVRIPANFTRPEDPRLPAAIKRGFYEQTNSGSFINLNVCVCDREEGSTASRSSIKPRCISNDKWNIHHQLYTFIQYTCASIRWNIPHGSFPPGNPTERNRTTKETEENYYQCPWSRALRGFEDNVYFLYHSVAIEFRDVFKVLLI